jgi:rod shape determining protein RodA
VTATSWSADASGRRHPVARAPRPSDDALGRVDWVLLAAVLALALMGGLLIWSTTAGSATVVGTDSLALVRRHGVNVVIGLGLALAAGLVNYRLLRAYAPMLYLLSLLGLFAVLSPLGSVISGARSWIILPGGLSVQPSEFAKLALVVGMAMILAEKRDAEDTPTHALVMQALLLAAVPLALIMLQPDLGTGLAVVSLTLGVIAVSGAPARWLVGLITLGTAVAVYALTSDVLEPYQRNRLTAFVDPSTDPRGAGYQIRQVLNAIGSGGLTGQGLGQGNQTQGSFVPAQQTDFIFSVAGEEMGLVGAGGIIVLFGIVFWRAYRIALRADDLFGRLVATGVLCWFAFHVVENIGMCLGLMPITGIPLPFVSYGGSSMFANMLAVGLLQNVHMKRYA